MIEDLRKKALAAAILGTLTMAFSVDSQTNRSVNTQVKKALCPSKTHAARARHTFVSVKPILWGTPLSPYVRKVLVILHEKGIKYDLKPVLPKVALEAMGQPIPKEFAKGSPLGKVPFYQEGDFFISDSAVIADYLEKKKLKPNLIPRKKEDDARVRWFQSYSDNQLGEVVTKNILFEKTVKPFLLKMETDQAKVKNAIDKELPEVCKYLESQIRPGKWLVGSCYTVADAAVSSQLYGLNVVNIKIDEKRFPKLSAYMERAMKRPSFQEAIHKIDFKSLPFDPKDLK